MILLKRTYITAIEAATQAVHFGAINGATMIWRLIKFLFVLIVLAAIGFVGYAYLGPIFMPDDFIPEVQEVVKPVILGADG